MLWFQQLMLQFCIPKNYANRVTLMLLQQNNGGGNNTKQQQQTGKKTLLKTLYTTAPLHICLHLSCSKALQQTSYL